MVGCGSDSEILEPLNSSKVSGTLMTGLGSKEFQLGDPAPVIMTRPDESGSGSVRAKCMYLMENWSPHTHRTAGARLVRLQSFADLGSTCGWAVNSGGRFPAGDV